MVKGNTTKDIDWGNCTCMNCINIEGQNVLGKLLMRVRDEIREEIINHGHV